MARTKGEVLLGKLSNVKKSMEEVERYFRDKEEWDAEKIRMVEKVTRGCVSLFIKIWDLEKVKGVKKIEGMESGPDLETDHSGA